MVESLVKKIEKITNETDNITIILGMQREEYKNTLQEAKKELMEILKTGRYSSASIKLLKWLGFKDEEIDISKILKAIAIINSFVTIINMAEKTRMQ